MRATPLAVIATLAAAAAGTAAVADGASPPAQKVTPARVGGVHLGDRHASLRARGLVGPIRPGCQLAENTRSARLKTPLTGSVNYTQSNPRRVTNILVEGGAKARGVGVGARPRAIRRAFPKATFDHGSEDVFGITLVKVPKSGGGRLQFAVSTETHRVTLIGVPFIAFCE
jgi:hypothetical protein